MRRGVLANLDVEAVVAGRPLPERVAQRVAAVGSLLRVFAEPGEPLWTPRPLGPGRVLPVEELGPPELVSGPGATLRAPRIAWCAHRDPRLLSRRFDDDCARTLESRLAGTCWVDDLAQLVDQLGEGPFTAGAAWVLKPALSAGGRGSLRGRGAALLDGTPVAASPAVAALFAGAGALLMPWVQRIDDVGCRARLSAGRVSIEGLHRLLVTPSGGFRGVDVLLGDGPLPDLPVDEAARLVEAATTAGARLMALGYEGPFGVDGFAYRGPDGERRFLAQCEVNVRCTFGFVTAAWAERVGTARGWAPGTRVGLRFGSGQVPECADVPLLAPGTADADDTTAWLQVERPRPTSGSPAAAGTRTARG